MAIIQNPLIGRSSQKLGNSVFSTQFGNNILKSKPLDVKNPRTAKQMKHRKKFKLMVYLMRQLVPVLKAAYTNTVKGMSPFNKMVAYNLKNAYYGDEINWSLFKICDNIGSCVTDVVIQALAGHKLHIAWQPNTTQDSQNWSAYLDAILINTKRYEVFISPDFEYRHENHATIVVPEEWIGDIVVCFIKCLDYSAGADKDPKHVFTDAVGGWAPNCLIIE